MFETEVTKVTIDSFTPQPSGVCAEVTVVINDVIAIHKISVISGDRGLFVSMPNTGKTRMTVSGKRYTDLVRPLSRDMSNKINEAVISCYNKRLNK